MDTLLWGKCLLIMWAGACAVMDYRQRRLPNTLTLGAAGIAIFYLLLYGKSMLGASPESAVAAGIGIILCLSPFMGLGWMGAGDIKLMSAIGFIGGFQVLLTTFVLSSLLTVPIALWLSIRGVWRREQGDIQKLRLPQGVFIALGLMLAMLGDNASGAT